MDVYNLNSKVDILLGKYPAYKVSTYPQTIIILLFFF